MTAIETHEPSSVLETPIEMTMECWACEMKVLAQSSIGRALKSMVDNWQGLVGLLDDPRIPLSNNHTEREVRGPVVGRKNFGGCKMRRSHRASATKPSWPGVPMNRFDCECGRGTLLREAPIGDSGARRFGSPVH